MGRGKMGRGNMGRGKGEKFRKEMGSNHFFSIYLLRGQKGKHIEKLLFGKWNCSKTCFYTYKVGYFLKMW